MGDIEHQLDKAYRFSIRLFAWLTILGVVSVIWCLLVAPIWIPCGVALSLSSAAFMVIFVLEKKANTASE